jgi:hypothetical protein
VAGVKPGLNKTTGFSDYQPPSITGGKKRQKNEPFGVLPLSMGRYKIGKPL